jgi:hypothetical protein
MWWDLGDGRASCREGIGALGVAVGTWLLVFAWALAGWLTAVDGGIGGLLLFSTRVWLAGPPPVRMDGLHEWMA